MDIFTEEFKAVREVFLLFSKQCEKLALDFSDNENKYNR